MAAPPYIFLYNIYILYSAMQGIIHRARASYLRKIILINEAALRFRVARGHPEAKRSDGYTCIYRNIYIRGAGIDFPRYGSLRSP